MTNPLPQGAIVSGRKTQVLIILQTRRKLGEMTECRRKHYAKYRYRLLSEEATLEQCVDQVRRIADAELNLQIIIVHDGSKDRSLEEAKAQLHGQDSVMRQAIS